MTKWHNGPNGPGLCRATKGKCPYGGEESHFGSKEEAMEVFNRDNEIEFGLLPTNLKKGTTMLDSKGNQLSASNFVSTLDPRDNAGFLSNEIEKNCKNGLQFVEYANKNEKFRGMWEVHSTEKDKVTLSSTDNNGQVSYLTIEDQNIGAKTNSAIKRKHDKLLFPKENPFEKENSNPWFDTGDYDFIKEKGSQTYVRQSLEGEDTYEFLSYRYNEEKEEYLVYKGKMKVTEEDLDYVQGYVGISDNERAKTEYNSKYDPEDVASIVDLKGGSTWDNDPGKFKPKSYSEDLEKFRKSIEAHGV